MPRIIALLFALIVMGAGGAAVAEETDPNDPSWLRVGPVTIEVILAGEETDLVPYDYADATFVPDVPPRPHVEEMVNIMMQMHLGS